MYLQPGSDTTIDAYSPQFIACVRISRLTVVSCEAKEEVPCDGPLDERT